MLKSNRSSKLISRSTLLSLAAIAGISSMQTAQAATLTYDTSTTTGVQPTSGNWDTTTSNWSISPGTTLQAWTQTSGNVPLNAAVFAGADGAYSINMTTGIATQTVAVNNDGYTLTASSPQTLNVNNVGSGIFTIANSKTFTVGNNATISYNGSNNTGTRYNLGNGSVFNVAAGGTLTKVSGVGFGGFGFRPNAAGDSSTINVDGTITWNSTNSGSGSLTFCESVAGTVTVNVNNGGLITTNTVGTQNLKGAITVGDAGTSVLNVKTGGVVNITNTASSSFLCIGGTGNAGVGTVNLDGGSITAPQISKKGSGTASGILNFNGGTLTASIGTFNTATNAFIGAATGTGGTGTFALNRANVRDGGAKINTNGFDVWVSQALLHSDIGGDAATDGGLIKSGGGVLTLSAANTYTGATAINNGGIKLTGSLTSNVAVAGGATFSGTGSTTGSITLNGGQIIADVGGTFLTGQNVSIASASTFALTGVTTPSTTYTLFDYGVGGSLTGLANLTGAYRGTPFDDVANHKVKVTVLGTGTLNWNVNSGTWDVNNTPSWTGYDTKFFAGDATIFGDPTADSTVTKSGTLSPASVTVQNTAFNYTFSGSGSISGATSISKSNAGTLTLASANAYTGGTTFNGGTLNINDNAAIGTGPITVASGSAKVLDSTTAGITLGTNAQAWNDDFTFGGTNDLNMGTGNVTLGGGDRTVTLSNGKKLTVGKIGSTVGGLSLAGSGTLAVTTAALSSLSGTLNVGANATLQINTGALSGTTNDFSAASLTGSGTIVNGGGVERWLFVNGTTDSTFSGNLQNGGVGPLGLNKQGTGTLTISGTSNTYTGATNVLNNGVLKITGALSNTGSTTIGGSSGTLGVLQVSSTAVNPLGINPITFDTFGNSSQARLELSGGSSLANAITLAGRNNASVAIQNLSGNNSLTGSVGMVAGGSTYTIQSDAGSLAISGISIATSGTRNVTLTGAGNGSVSAITNGGGTLGVIKSGGGTWSLTGTSTYTGLTSITNGTLVVDGSITSNVSISGTGVLAGSGTISGTIAYTGGTLAPGNSPGTLTINNALTLDTATTLAYDLNGANVTVGGGINDLTTGVSNLTLDGTLNVSETVAGSFLSALPGDTWRLINYTGSLTDNGLALGTVPALAFGYMSFTVDTTTAGQVNLIVVPEPTTIATIGLGFGALLRRRRKI